MGKLYQMVMYKIRESQKALKLNALKLEYDINYHIHYKGTI